MVKSCRYCQKIRLRKRDLDVARASLMTKGPFDECSLDVIGPLPPDENGNKFIIVMIDNFSHFVFAEPIKDTTAESAAKFHRQSRTRRPPCWGHGMAKPGRGGGVGVDRGGRWDRPCTGRENGLQSRASSCQNQAARLLLGLRLTAAGRRHTAARPGMLAYATGHSHLGPE